MPRPTNLRDEEYFPSFDDCPAEDEINFDYYTSSPDENVLRPSRHWCLFAEIMEISHLVRVRIVAKDKLGKQFPIAFYENAAEQDFGIYKEGRTVAILYAKPHGFLDLTVGIRQEDVTSIRVSSRRVRGGANSRTK